MYQLYILPGSCSLGIHTLLNQLDIPVDIIRRDDVPDYPQLVPTNQVPALKTPDNLLTEGAAISLHLLAKHGHKELVADQEFTRWLMFNYATLHPAYSKLFSLNAMMPESESRQILMQRFADRLTELWAIVDRHLQGRSYMHGDMPTVIDYLLAVYVRWGNMFPSVAIPVGNNVLALVERVNQLPEFIKALARENITYSIPQNAIAASMKAG